MKSTKKIGIGMMLIGIIGILYIYFFNHFKIKVPCIFHEITGFYCPGCGMTRCLNALLHFDFYQAFRYNMLMILLIPFFTIYLCGWIYLKVTKKEVKWKNLFPDWVWYVLLIIVILFGILRNILPFLEPTVI